MRHEAERLRAEYARLIGAYIELKMEEVTRFRMTTHPIEYEMYYSL